MNIKKLSVLSIMCISVLCGCADQKINADETTVFVHKNGKITDAIVETFDQNYYDAAELQTMTNREITAYNQTTGDVNSAVLSDFVVEDGVAKVYIEFEEAEDYADFNQTECFFGTVAKAHEAGYALDTPMKSVNGKETLDQNTLLEKGKYKLLIIQDHVDIRIYNKILYTSANVEVLDDNHAKISEESTGLAYILIK